jgi:4-nitrophenyl phosphatase
MKNFTKLDLQNIQALVADMDGVFWRGDTPLPGLIDFFDFLHSRSIPYMLATNNASKTQDQYVQKFARFGIAVDRERILTSSLATAAYLRSQFANGAKAYVVGQEGLRSALREAGFQVKDDSSEPVDVVAAGIDFELTYATLKHAVLLIQRGARFVGTNGDLTFPIEGGFAPGAGSILAAIQAATGVEPVVIGKPGRIMFDIALQKMGTSPQVTAMLGDRLETDIIGGQQAGLKTIMVATGVDNEDTITQKSVYPDILFDGIDELAQYWANM